MKIHHLGAIPDAFCDAYGKGAVSKRLGDLAGSSRLTVTLDVVPPGGHSAKFHAHSVQEEFFLVLAGAGILRTAEGEFPVRAGDFLAKPAGFANPHALHNSGTAPLEILDIATTQPGDVAFYPDDEVYLLRGGGGGTVLRGGGAPPGWTSEPDV